MSITPPPTIASNRNNCTPVNNEDRKKSITSNRSPSSITNLFPQTNAFENLLINNPGRFASVLSENKQALENRLRVAANRNPSFVSAINESQTSDSLIEDSDTHIHRPLAIKPTVGNKRKNENT